MPEKKEKMETLAKTLGFEISILPRIGISEEKDTKSIKILAYQMMGIENNGNTCPFLDRETGK